jgi:ABC-type Fe3+/spermidine/putrescine transport system ATPase subunit
VAEFIGTMNRLVSTVADDGVLEYAGHRLRVDAARGLPRGERVLLLVRPETVELRPAGDDPLPEDAFAGEIISRIFLGPVTRIRIETPGDESGLTADVPTARARSMAVGANVVATFPQESGRLLSLAEQPEPAPAPDDR